MSDAVVDIVIVTRNGRHHLEECLPSIVGETKGVRYEIVVVDNDSEDGTGGWLDTRWPDVTVIENAGNEGFARASNQGIERTDGRYILLLNNDTILKNDVASILVDCVEANPAAALAGPLMLYPDGDLQPSIYHFPSTSDYLLQMLGIATLLGLGDDRVYFPYGPFDRRVYATTNEVEWMSGACLLFPRELVDEIGMLDEHMPFGVEDMDLARRARDAGYRNYFTPEARVVHKKGASHRGDDEGQRETRKFVLSAYRDGVLRYFEKHHTPLEHLLMKASFLAGSLPRAVFR